MTTTTTTLLDGLFFSEGPRWHDGRLWFSDFYDHRVRAVTPDGRVSDVVEVAGQPSGLGWLPDGRLLVVSMTDQRVLRLEPDGSLVEHADLSNLAGFWANEMHVDPGGHAYVGSFGFDLHRMINEQGYEAVLADPTATESNLMLVRPDGTVSLAADRMQFPNGTVLSDDGRTLIVAETLALRLTAFDVADDATLSNRRVWADLSGEWISPDGIALDPTGAVWVANAIGREAVRVGAGGEILDRVETSQHCYACALGGDAGTTLFACTATSSDPAIASGARSGRIETAEVDLGRGTSR